MTLRRCLKKHANWEFWSAEEHLSCIFAHLKELRKSQTLLTLRVQNNETNNWTNKRLHCQSKQFGRTSGKKKQREIWFDWFKVSIWSCFCCCCCNFLLLWTVLNKIGCIAFCCLLVIVLSSRSLYRDLNQRKLDKIWWRVFRFKLRCLEFFVRILFVC